MQMISCWKHLVHLWWMNNESYSIHTTRRCCQLTCSVSAFLVSSLRKLTALFIWCVTGWFLYWKMNLCFNVIKLCRWLHFCMNLSHRHWRDGVVHLAFLSVACLLDFQSTWFVIYRAFISLKYCSAVYLLPRRCSKHYLLLNVCITI